MKQQEWLDTLQPKHIDNVQIFEDFYKSVNEFNTMLGLHDNIDVQPQKREALITQYAALCKEEGLQEFNKALNEQDKVELLDALIDFLVVGGEYQYAKEGFLPDAHAIYDNLTLDYLVSRFKQYLRDLKYVEAIPLVQSILTKLDIDLEGALGNVLMSNWSKIPTVQELLNSATEYQSLEDIIQLEIDVIESAGRYSGVFYKKHVDSQGYERVSFWATKEYGEGKVKYVKPMTFIEPTLADYWK